jgi:hypothetical protein
MFLYQFDAMLVKNIYIDFYHLYPEISMLEYKELLKICQRLNTQPSLGIYHIFKK